MIARTTYLTEEQILSTKHNVLMYGAGTQSTGLLLMALNGDLGEKPDFAIFADTGGEPMHVIEYKDYFAEYVYDEYGFEIKTVSNGNLLDDINKYLRGETKRVAQIPLYSETGLLMRQCTMEYKITVADNYIKERIGIRRKNKEQESSVALWMGISIDELQRLKTSTQWWKTLIYPLVENGFRRDDTIRYVAKHGLKEPPRSACFFCPFHSNAYWKYLHDNHNDEYQKAIVLDDAIRDYPKMRQKMYLHKSKIPLRDVNYNQRDLLDLIDECDGYCGI